MFTPAPLPRTLTAALRDLASPRPNVRASAAHDLAAAGRDGPERAGDALRPLLSDPVATVRAEAVLALGELGISAAVEEVVAMLRDSDSHVRQYATIALGDIGGEAAVAALERARTAGDPDVRFQATMALAALDPKRGFEAALAAITDEDPWVACDASLQIADLLDGRWAWPGPTEFARAREALRGLGATSDSRVAACAAMALVKLGDERGVKSIVRFLSERPLREHEYLRVQAIEALARLGDDASLAALASRAWRTFPSEERDVSRAALAARGDERAARWLRKMLFATGETPRERALQFIARTRACAFVPDLVEAMKSDDAMRIGVIRVLGILGDSRARATLAAAVRDANEAVAEAAREAMERFERVAAR